MRLAVAIIAASVLGACGPDSKAFGVLIELERDPGQMCMSDVCSGIAMTCAATVQIRIIDDVTDRTYYSECFQVAPTGDLCALNDLDIPNPSVENGMVRIQIAIWPTTPDTMGCPDVTWTLDGKAEAVDDPLNPSPAIAGQGYFDVGSSSLATVVLGCLNEPVLDTDECRNNGTVELAAGVLDFDTNLSVSPTVQNLIVAVGEPMFDGTSWSMPASATEELEKGIVAGIPVWAGPLPPNGAVDLMFTAAACIQVFEDSTGPVTNTLSCRPASPTDTALDLDGVLVRKATLDKVQQAIGGAFPSGGLVLGRVLDHTGQPAVGAIAIPASGATVAYLSDDLMSITGGTSTTSSGAFVSLDASFDTIWGADIDSTISTAPEVEPQLGGLVTGKVTVIELQLTQPVSK